MEELEDYCNDKERRFTVGHLEIRDLSGSDIAIIGLYTLTVSLQLILYFLSIHKFSNGLLFLIAGIVCMFTVTTPFGIRFRSVYFSLIWFVASALLVLNRVTISHVPLYCFLLYHGIRLVFWYKYNMEFIPYQITRGKMWRYVSKIEGRGGRKEGKFFMLILAFLGFCVFMYGLFGVIGMRL